MGLQQPCRRGQLHGPNNMHQWEQSCYNAVQEADGALSLHPATLSPPFRRNLQAHLRQDPLYFPPLHP